VPGANRYHAQVGRSLTTAVPVMALLGPHSGYWVAWDKSYGCSLHQGVLHTLHQMQVCVCYEVISPSSPAITPAAASLMDDFMADYTVHILKSAVFCFPPCRQYARFLSLQHFNPCQTGMRLLWKWWVRTIWNYQKSVVCIIVNFCFVCKGAVAVSAETFGEGSASRLLSRADCVGNESTLLQCPTTQYSGGGCVTSGVACQGEHTV